jgi:hypothetical protein
MVNKQLTPAAKLKRAEKSLGAKATDDPEGVLAVLQTARRLLADGGDLLKDGWQETQARKKPTKYSLMGALRHAVDLAHPADRHRAVTAAQHALQVAMEKDKTAVCGMAHLPTPVLTRWESHPQTTLEDALRIYDAAILAQGRVNQTQRKQRGRK